MPEFATEKRRKPQRPRLEVIEGTSDDELLTSYIEGDKSAFDILVRRYHPTLTRFVDGIIHNHARAEEIIQEVFLKLTSHAHDIHRGTLKSWLYTAARNTAFNESRDTRRHTEIEYEHADEMPLSRDCRTTPEYAVNKMMQRKILQGLMKKLPEPFAEILQLRYFDDLSNNEIAERLHIELGTVGSRLNRARQALQDLIQQRGLSTELGIEELDDTTEQQSATA